jgi:hypothetical protein
MRVLEGSVSQAQMAAMSKQGFRFVAVAKTIKGGPKLAEQPHPDFSSNPVTGGAGVGTARTQGVSGGAYTSYSAGRKQRGGSPGSDADDEGIQEEVMVVDPTINGNGDEAASPARCVA